MGRTQPRDVQAFPRVRFQTMGFDDKLGSKDQSMPPE